MQNRNTIDVTHTLDRGMGLFKSTWVPFIKFALLSVIASYLVSIYVAVFDTFFSDAEVVYVIGLVLLVLLYLPIVYYSIRITMTNVTKLKLLILNKSMDYKRKFRESKDQFWRVLLILIIRFVLKGVAIGSFGAPVLYIYTLLNPETYGPLLSLWGLGFTTLICTGIFISAVYLLIRLEFATLLVYWDVESPDSDLKTSMHMTKHHLVDKIKVMFVAHLPGFLLSIVSLIYVFLNLESFAGWMRWAYIVLSIVVNTMLFSWVYACYYPLFEQMKMFTLEKEKIVDAEGREWSTY